MNDFLPQNYTLPETESRYLKFKPGITRFRFLTSPIVGTVWFEQDETGKKTVHRVKLADKQPNPNSKPKHFWAAVIYDWDNLSVKILEITQKSIQEAIIALTKNPKWGNPKDYDICVERIGEGMDTEYHVMPEPKTPPLVGTLEEAQKINLEALWTNADPFIKLN